tara:strand:- start:594 stop:797 length:204 start_codon:yes stop_codon:yes gene_type:complete
MIDNIFYVAQAIFIASTLLTMVLWDIQGDMENWFMMILLMLAIFIGQNILFFIVIAFWESQILTKIL